MSTPSVRPPLGVPTAMVDRLAGQLQARSMTARFAFWAALLVFVSLAALTELLVSFRASEVASARHAATLSFASELRARADRELNSVLFLASGFVGYFVVRHQQASPEEVNSIMAAVYASGRHIRNFSIAVGYRPTYVYPLTGNEKILGRDYRDLPEQWPAVKLAIESRKLVLTGPVNLVQGGRALIYRVPIYVKDSYWGLLATVIDIESFEKAAFAELDREHFEFAIRSEERSLNGGGLLWGRPELFADRHALQFAAEVPNGKWVYAVRARDQAGSPIIWAMRGAGWAMAVLAAFCVGLVLRQRSELARHAGFDSLTNLPNRRLFDDRMEQAFRRHSRHAGGQIAALFMDLDGFKQINDRYGHKVGDLVLRTIAARIREEVRLGDTVARWAGDEFAIIIEEADEALVDQLVERLQSRIAIPFAAGGVMLSVRVSIGAAFYPGEADSSIHLLELADSRMYEAKARSRAGAAPG
jgi:diguanylate cyclase (GGDEF)-like protein